MNTMGGVELTGGDAANGVSVVVDPARGGRVRRATVHDRNGSVELLAPVADDAPAWSSGWGSFPMAPWAGRIRNGRFVVDGTEVRLDLNHQDGDGDGGSPLWPPQPVPEGELDASTRRRHAIHGTVFTRPWTLDAVDGTRCALSCPLTGALGWPFAGTARQVISVTPSSVTFTLSVEAGDDASFPAAIGWHPWFAKPDRLEFTPNAMYERDDVGLPTGRLVPPTPRPWDDCFTHRGPIRLHHDRDVAGVVTVDSDCDHVVVFDRPAHATCVEPQSGPPDAPTVRPEVVAPGRPLRRTMTWSW